MRPLANHIHAAILRAIAEAIGPVDREKPILVVEQARSTDWASATFLGATHEFDLRLEGPPALVALAMQRLVDLPEREVAIAGHIVAEIAAYGGAEHNISSDMVSKQLTVNVLTIID